MFWKTFFNNLEDILFSFFVLLTRPRWNNTVPEEAEAAIFDIKPKYIQKNSFHWSLVIWKPMKIKILSYIDIKTL